MKCVHAQLFLNEYADNQLTEEQRQPIEAHVEQCQQCKDQLLQIIELKNQLSGIHFSDNIADTVIANAINQAELQYNPPQKPVPIYKASYFAIAASFFLILSLGFLVWQPAQQSLEPMNSNVIAEKKLNLLFEAPKALENVTFTVTLPGDIEMQGFPGLKQVSWQGSIKQGKNLLSIPIISNKVNEAIIITELSHQNTKRTFKINYRNDKLGKHIT